jgi:two-component system chemotaxis response regulator CheY
MQRIIVVDESPVICKVAKRILTGFDFTVVESNSLSQARNYCEAELPDVIVIDSDLDGALDLIADIRAMEGGKDIRIVYSLVEADLKRMMAGRRAGASDFLLKPFDRTSLFNVFGSMKMAA